MIKAYSKFLDILEKIQIVLLTVSVPAMVLIMFYQVIMRYVFANSPAWSEELVRYLFIFNVMMAAAIAVRRNSHLQIDILLNVLKPGPGRSSPSAPPPWARCSWCICSSSPWSWCAAVCPTPPPVWACPCPFLIPVSPWARR